MAGGSTNADRVFVDDHVAIVLDGASAFEPGVHAIDPGTYAGTLGSALLAELAGADDVPLPDAVAQAIRRTVAALDLSTGAAPSSTVAVLRVGRAAGLYVLGDSPIIYGTAGATHRISDDRLRRLPIPERASYVQALRSGGGYSPAHRATLVALQRAERRYRNTDGGYWIAEADPAAAHRGISVTVTAEHIQWAVLATDGAANPIDQLGAPGWPEIAQYTSAELACLLARLHAWEEHDDPNGRRLPRSKPHDDKAIVTVPQLWA